MAAIEWERYSALRFYANASGLAVKTTGKENSKRKDAKTTISAFGENDFLVTGIRALLGFIGVAPLYICSLLGFYCSGYYGVAV